MEKIVMVPVDPSTATELRPDFLRAMATGDSLLVKTVRQREPNFPLWDEIATGIWLNPELITKSELLYIDAVTQFGRSYGETLSWAPGDQPELGEQLETAVREVDVPGLEKLMVRLMNRPAPPAP